MSGLILLAKSSFRKEYDYHKFIDHEWAIEQVDKEEKRDELVKLFGCREIYGFSNPYVSMRRIVKYYEESVTSYGEWDILGFADGQFKAALEIGDSDYYTKSKGYNSLHNDVCKYVSKVNTYKQRIEDLEDSITPHKFQRASSLQQDYENRYMLALKQKRLYKKSLAGLVDQKIIDEIRNPLREEYHKEHQQITEEIEEYKQKLEELEDYKNNYG